MRIAALAAFLSVLSMSAGASTLYKWVDADGKEHLTTDKPPAGAQVIFRKTVKDAPAPPQAHARPWPDEYRQPSSPADARLEVVMYATSRCPFCRKARQYFASRGVSWREIDIESSSAANREFNARGGQGVPLIFINGSRVMGWDAARVGALLDQALTRR